MPRENRPCPFCGGEIKVAATFCKHCKQPVPPPEPRPALTGVDAEIHQVIVSRGLMTETQFEDALDQREGTDVDLLEFLSRRGLLTAAQAQNVRASFKTQAIGEANRLGRIALDKMLITQEQFEQALEVIKASTEDRRIPEVLFALGFITEAQRDSLGSGTSPSVPAPVSAPRSTGPSTPRVVPSSPIRPLSWRLALIFNAISIGVASLGTMLRVGDSDWYQYTDQDVVIGLLAFFALAAGVVFSCMLLHRCWSAVADASSPVSPGKAVGFLFIPFFNLYWFFVAFPKLAVLLIQRTGTKPYSKGINSSLGTALASLLAVSACFTCFNALAANEVEGGGLIMLDVLELLISIATFIVWLLFFKDVSRVVEDLRSETNAR